MAANQFADSYAPSDIRKRGIEILTKELGPVGVAHFLRLFDRGEGDYTKDREELLAGITTEDLMRGLEEKKKSESR